MNRTEVPTFPPLETPMLASEWAAMAGILTLEGYTYAPGVATVPPEHVASVLLGVRGHRELSQAWSAWRAASDPYPLPLPTEDEAAAEYRRLVDEEKPRGTMRAAIGYAERFGFEMVDRVYFLTGRGERVLRQRVRHLREALPIVEELAELAARGKV